MIQVDYLFSYLKKKKINFYCGVPDSVLKKTSTHLDKLKKNKHIITHNEGGAIALAAGYHLKEKKIACVYLQNSGLGNIINPLISMAHKNVYSIPMILLIGWRGAPKTKDEPQHIAQGKITREILKLLDINHCVLNNIKDFNKLDKLIIEAKSKSRPIACLIKKDVLQSLNKKIPNKDDEKIKLKRHQVITHIVKEKKQKIKIFSTTGFTSRELYKIRKINNQKTKDFYNVGAMGHSSMLALGYSLFSKKKKILCLDGDGALLMHMGSLGTIGEYANKNFKHIVFNNKQHESVGGQKTPVTNVNFKKLSISCGYKNYFVTKNITDFKKKYPLFLSKNGPSFFEIIVSSGTLNNLGRPNNLIDIKKNFQKY